MNKQEDRLLKELVAGIVIYGIVVQVILMILHRDFLYLTVGLWIGLLTAAGMIIHMKRSLEEALEYGEVGAEKHVRKTYAIRLAVIIIVFGLTFYFKLGSMLTTFIGVMGLKVSAYLQPHMNKLFQKLTKSK